MSGAKAIGTKGVSGSGRPVIKPCRHIELTPDGAALTIRGWFLDTPQAAHRMTDGKAIPPAEIAGWLRTERLPHDSSVIDELATALNLIRVTVPADEALSFDPMADVVSALAVLTERVPPLVSAGSDAETAAAERGDIIAAREHRNRKAAFENLMLAVQRVEAHLRPSAPRRHKAQAWHDDAMWLVFILRAAADAAGVPISFKSSNGPGVRFIRTALKRACNLNLDLPAIAAAVARHAASRVPQRKVSI